MLTIGAQAMYIGCNDTSVIVINFRKSKTHAITDTYCTVTENKNQEKIVPSYENEKRTACVGIRAFMFILKGLCIF